MTEEEIQSRIDNILNGISLTATGTPSVGPVGEAFDPTTTEGQLNLATLGVSGGLSAISGAAGGPTIGGTVEDALSGPELPDTDTSGLTEAQKEAQELASGRFEQIVTPGLEIGQAAQQQQAAFSGALGPEAQAAAYASFQESPATQFLREQGLREVNSQSAVTGQGGGNRLRSLTDFSQGLALQDLSRQQQQLGQISAQGLQSAGIGAQLTGQEISAITGLAQADLQSQQFDAQMAAQNQANQQAMLGNIAGLATLAFL